MGRKINNWRLLSHRIKDDNIRPTVEHPMFARIVWIKGPVFAVAKDRQPVGFDAGLIVQVTGYLGRPGR